VLIETIPAAFEMEEILYELRDHCSGLNAGRWDYLFSIIKTLRDAPGDHTLPDRNAVTMNAPMMRAYADLLVATCHRRGAFAMGGMAAFIPSRRDAAVNEAALAKVREDKTREARQGFDGSWVAHPDLVPLCAEIFDELMPTPNQVSLQRDVEVTADDLLDVAATPGARTLDGLRTNVEVGITYVAAWLSGNGAAAIHHLMEDAATAEISRSQIWQWAHSAAVLDDGTVVDRSLVERVVAEEYDALVAAAGPYAAHLSTARDLFLTTALDDTFADFLTLPAYDEVLRAGG
jgi:malate synthase